MHNLRVRVICLANIIHGFVSFLGRRGEEGAVGGRGGGGGLMRELDTLQMDDFNDLCTGFQK